MIHCGTSGEEWKKLHERLRRILWMSDREITEETGFEDYGAVFVDEAHLLSEEPLKRIIRAAGTRPVIFSVTARTSSPRKRRTGVRRMSWKNFRGSSFSD